MQNNKNCRTFVYLLILTFGLFVLWSFLSYALFRKKKNEFVPTETKCGDRLTHFFPCLVIASDDRSKWSVCHYEFNTNAVCSDVKWWKLWSFFFIHTYIFQFARVSGCSNCQCRHEYRIYVAIQPERRILCKVKGNGARNRWPLVLFAVDRYMFSNKSTLVPPLTVRSCYCG